MMRYLMGLVCCLLTISAFSEEEKSRKLSIKDISIASADTSENPSLKWTTSTDEVFPKSGSLTFESTYKDSLQQEIAYPIEELDCEKPSGGNQ